MDHDKDGVIGKEDLRQTFDSVGRLATDKELDEMIEEVPGPINFTQLLTLFAARMSGGSYETYPACTLLETVGCTRMCRKR